MNVNQNLGVILLSLWLILAGILRLVAVTFPGESIVLALLALAAGVLILIKPSSVPRGIGAWLLSIWLIVTGLFDFLGLTFVGEALVMGLLAIAAGLLLLLGRSRR